MIARTDTGRIDLTDPVAVAILDVLEANSSDSVVAADAARAALELGWWELFLSLAAPDWVAHPYAEWHRTVLQWAADLRPGVKPRPLIVCAPRGAGKSTVLSLSLLGLIARSHRSYALWVGNTQRQTEDALGGVGELLASPLFAAAFPAAATQYQTEQGRARDWTKNRLRTASGFTLDGIGLDQAMRGARIGNLRPDIVIFDDIEDAEDTPATTTKKRRQMTDALIPAGSDDVAIVYVQNRIHPAGSDGIMAELVERRSDMLADAIVIGPVPMIENLTFDEQQITEADPRRYVITGGRPSWEGQGLATAEQMINETGLGAFLRERQHEDAPEDGGMFDPSHWEHSSRDDYSPRDFVNVCRSWDLAFTAGGGDFTVGVLLGLDRQSRTVVLDVVRDRLEFAHVLELIADVANQDNRWFSKKVAVVVEEMPAAGKGLRSQIERELVGNLVEFVRPQSSKTERAAVWASEVQRGRVTIAVDEPVRATASELVREHASFPRGRHDDTVDACTQGHTWLTMRRKSRGHIGGAAARTSISY